MPMIVIAIMTMACRPRT